MALLGFVQYGDNLRFGKSGFFHVCKLGVNP
jgi:hypothetical protein